MERISQTANSSSVRLHVVGVTPSSQIPWCSEFSTPNTRSVVDRQLPLTGVPGVPAAHEYVAGQLVIAFHVVPSNVLPTQNRALNCSLVSFETRVHSAWVSNTTSLPLTSSQNAVAPAWSSGWIERT